MVSLEQARAALRERQGDGARYEAPEAPAETLGWARLGTAYFARLLNNLADTDLRKPSLVPGWRRSHIVAQVGYQARALTRLTEWAASGTPQAMYPSERARLDEVENGSTLPTRALRGLFRHAAVHLDVEWRDLSGPAWDAELALPDGRLITARDTGWIRAREIWLRAVDLDAGGSFLDMPAAFVDRLLEETPAGRNGAPFVLWPTDRTAPLKLGDGKITISGRAADLARWVTGRGARRLLHDQPLPPMAAPNPTRNEF
ncbi:maleylpyruvate isomerase [Bosea sp. AK1]|uniref:maleylpyruvate isomerase family mycothiol-dependent enzyme n=1 Tax=Bosea sp. AK1 TaxID=2587160 RepID=UPI001167F913|nr:maleylpyruvate isomerase family mycothiol-dependent enzyme [Bosea sp. AK1]TQI65327.1 maleylpyruvate isomerase [Bosea sp. AK1]